MSKVLACDIDGVVLDKIGDIWLQYLISHYRLKPEYIHLRWNLGDFKLPYNLTELFDFTECETSPGQSCGTEGFEWWSSFDLYDNMAPRQDSIQYLKLLSDEGWDVIFVSKAMGFHHSSKMKFIEKWFPFAKACILTSEKQYVGCDVLVDDYVGNLNKMPSDVKLYRFRRDYFTPEQETQPMKTIYNFEELYDNLIGGCS